MADAARSGHIHVLVDYETTWYASNTAAYDLLQSGALGEPRKFVAHDGHDGPFHMQPEFVQWLSDPKLNGAGALFDFGCYGADLATWMMKGQAPVSVTAITKQMQPERYPKVDDEADVLVELSVRRRHHSGLMGLAVFNQRSRGIREDGIRENDGRQAS